MDSVSWTCPFTLTATSLVVVLPSSLAGKPTEWSLPNSNSTSDCQQFFQWEGMIASLACVKPISGSCCPQSKFQASAYHCNQFLLNSYSTGSLGHLSLCLDYSLPPFIDSSLTHQPGLSPWQPLFVTCLWNAFRTIFIRPSTTWLRGGKHRHIITGNVINSC